MKNQSIKGFIALAVVGSTSALTLLAAPTPSHAFSLSDLDPFNKNGALRQGLRKMDVTDQSSAIRQAGRYMDLSNKNSGLSQSTVGRFVNKVGRAYDPFNPQRNGGMWQKLDITDPNQPISQFCDPIAKYGVGGATAYFSGSPQAGMMTGGAASSALCGGGSNYGASRNAAMGVYQQEPAGGYQDFSAQEDYIKQAKDEFDRQQAIREAHDLRMSNLQRARGGRGLDALMQMQRRPLRLPSF